MFSPKPKQTKKKPKGGEDMLISLIVVIISQCVCIAKHHIEHLKYTQFLFVNYAVIKLRENTNRRKRNIK